VKPRKILHLDLDAFFCAVEEQHDPSLRGVAFAVGGQPDQRGVVASCSYAARRFGVRSALPMAQAVRLCPGLRIVSSHFDRYGQASSRVMAILHDLTPFVEQISIDEAFLDVTLLPELAGVLARRLQAAIRDQLDLPCSLGVATNKLLAKIATNRGKDSAPRGDYPNAIQIVPPGQEAAFLAPLPVRELWGVGPKTAEQLARLGIVTIGDLARRPADEMARRFGKTGAELAERARGIDERPVEPESETKSVSRETTFTRDVRDGAALKRTLRTLSDEVGHRLRKEGLRGSTIKIKLRWDDFTTLTRQTTLEQPTQHDSTIYDTAAALFEKHWPKGRPVRLIGVGVSGFEEAETQMGLWDAGAQAEQTRLESALDALKERFGDRIIRRGSDLLDSDS
jgi:DNA polymerase-4